MFDLGSFLPTTNTQAARDENKRLREHRQAQEDLHHVSLMSLTNTDEVFSFIIAAFPYLQSKRALAALQEGRRTRTALYIQKLRQKRAEFFLRLSPPGKIVA